MIDVPDSTAYIHDNNPDGVDPLLQYFDGMYVSGTYRQIELPQRPDVTIPPLRMRHNPPMYSPFMWNDAFSKLVGDAHPSVWRAFDSI